MDAAGLAQALGATRSGRQWKCRCVSHEDRSPSMIIFDGKEQVQVRCMAGCEPGDIINELRRRGLWDCRRPIEPPRAVDVSHETRNRDLARRLFDASLLCVGTPAQSYLQSREIWSVAREIEDIRYCDRCPREHYLQPAIVVAMRDVQTRSIHAVQRIYLSQDVHGRVIKDGAMMLGPVRNTAMMLGPYSVRQDKPYSVLHIAEGLETALSVMAMDHSPVWAMGSCGAIERFEVLHDVEQLTIWADHDGAGIKAANACGERWANAYHGVVIRTPHVEGRDFADVWRARCARQ